MFCVSRLGVQGKIYVDDINSLQFLHEKEGSTRGSGGPFFQYLNAHKSASHISTSTWK